MRSSPNETYNITQAFDVTAGVRFTSEKKTADSNYLDPDGGSACGQLLQSPGVGMLDPASPEYQFLLGYGCSTVFNPFFAGLSSSQSLSEGNVSGTVKLSYHFTDDVMAYASWANGYKAGGFNLARVTSTNPLTPLTPNLDTEFPRESVESYEVGVKSLLADRTVRLNAAVFDQQYTNFQLNTFTGIQFIVSSIRRVESKGAEINVNWATPLSGLTFDTGVVYAFTNITEFGDSLPLFAPNDTAATHDSTPQQPAVVCAAMVGRGLRDVHVPSPHRCNFTPTSTRNTAHRTTRARISIRGKSKAPMDC